MAKICDAKKKKMLLRLLSGIMYTKSSSCLKLLFLQHNVKHRKAHSSSFMHIFSQRAICETAWELCFQNSPPDKTTMGFKSTNQMYKLLQPVQRLPVPPPTC